jgi:hypothetical protein
MDDSSSVYAFAGISEVAETTTHLLGLALQQSGRVDSVKGRSLGDVEYYVLQQARDYLATVREGFVLSVRTSGVSQRAEIRYLLDRVLTDWDSLSRELGLALDDAGVDDVQRAGEARLDEDSESMPAQGQQPEVERVRRQLLAFGMAAIALGYLPRLPSRQVTFPQSYGEPPTYADIPVPRTPGEMLWRIEELEQTVWQIMSNDLGQLVQRRYGPVRRTYGFFETSAWLSAHEVERFGIGPTKAKLRRF